MSNCDYLPGKAGGSPFVGWPCVRASSCHFPEHGHDILLDRLDVGLGFRQRPRRPVLVEVAVEVDLVADDADLPVLRVTAVGVDPSVGNVGFHLALEEGLDALRQGHAFGVPLRSAIAAVDSLPAKSNLKISAERVYEKAVDKDNILGEVRSGIEQGVESAIPIIESVSFETSLGAVSAELQVSARIRRGETVTTPRTSGGLCDQPRAYRIQMDIPDQLQLSVR